MEPIAGALLTGAGIIWKALWTLAFGYLVSAGIQVLVTREQMTRALGERGAKKGVLAGFFGFVSSTPPSPRLSPSSPSVRAGVGPHAEQEGRGGDLARRGYDTARGDLTDTGDTRTVHAELTLLISLIPS